MNEGYLPLYRKYRPQKLEDVVGQSHIKTALSNAISLNKIAHAYLFTGPRGTGKTSTARILAKSLNCINGPTVTPCGECESCKAITNSVPIDVIEMDAASNRSVDDAHEILEKVNYAPVHGKYKIYIIDEVHMLTTQAFNALLKTLEEPPKNVIFILATTESHKVLPTIVSRCQRFDFKRITTSDIIEHLKKISQKENINITDNAISVIAKSAAGGMRDSLALLDQVSNIGMGKEITEEDINNLLGRLSFESLSELCGYIINSDGASAISLLEKIYNDGNEPIVILNNLLLYFKNLLVTKTCDKKSAIELTGLAEQQIDYLINTAQNVEKHQIVFLINKTADYIKELKETTNQQMWLEVALVDLSNLADNTKLIELESRLARLESGQNVVAPARQQVRPPVQPITQTVSQPAQRPVEPLQIEPKTNNADIVSQNQQPAPVNNISASAGDVKSVWQNVLANISSPGDRAILSNNASLQKQDDDNYVVLFSREDYVNKYNNDEKKQALANLIKNILGKEDVKITVRLRSIADEEITKVTVPQPKKMSAPPIDLVEPVNTVSEQEKETVKENIAAVKTHDTQQTEQTTRSDQSTMVRDLFDGKYLD